MQFGEILIINLRGKLIFKDTTESANISNFRWLKRLSTAYLHIPF